MATMTAGQRAAAATDMMATLSVVRESLGVTRADIVAAFAGADQYCHDNAAAMNAAIPQPARSVMTTTQKAMMYMLILSHRYKVGV